jgi:hypothetical protein
MSTKVNDKNNGTFGLLKKIHIVKNKEFFHTINIMQRTRRKKCNDPYLDGFAHETGVVAGTSGNKSEAFDTLGHFW